MRLVVIVLSVIVSIPLYAQTSTPSSVAVAFNQIPSHLQFIPRNEQNQGIVQISGAVQTPGVDSIVVEVLRNGSLWKRQSQRLSYSSNEASFNFQAALSPELVEYKIKVTAKTGSGTTVVAERDSIVCGDVYLIAGQSNGHPTSAWATYQNEFCRTLGVQTDSQNYKPYNPADTLWGYANGTGMGGLYSGPYLVGAWGIRLQQMLLEKFRVPTCIINGAAGGSVIEANLRNNANPEDLSTIYGKLLYRARKAKVAGHVKAIFWYQGESNWIYNYQNNFTQLYNAWMQDYPSTQKIYLFQIRPGCGNTHLELRELQRRLPDFFPKISLMSTVAVPGHDGCHYFLSGYHAIAENIFRLVARDFYYDSDVNNIDPPNVSRAYYTSPSRDEINVVLRNRNAGVRWPADTMVNQTTQKMVDYFYLDDLTGSVASGRVEGDTIKLRLRRSSNATRLTYLPDKYYHNTQIVYDGPWLKNSRGLGLLAFHNLPISNRDTVTSAIDDRWSVTEPAGFAIDQNYPNPFNGSTLIRYALPRAAHVTLKIYNMLGDEVAALVDGVREQGIQSIEWNAMDKTNAPCPSGLYFYRFVVTDPGGHGKLFGQAGKMVLLK